MSYVYYNPNPLKLSVGDCTIRAISCTLNISWKRTYLSLALQGFAMYDMGGSYADGGNSYMYYDPRYDQPMYSMARGGRGGYSRTDSKSEMVEELKGMMQETSDQTVKTAIQEAITKLNK